MSKLPPKPSTGTSSDTPSHHYGAGELNDLPVPTFAPIHRATADVFSAWRTMARDFYTPDTFAKLGAMKGVVLRIEETPHKPVGEETPGMDWMDFLDMEQATIKKLRVRIPEIHAALPVPKTIGKNATEEDNKIIDLYDLFPPKDLDINADPVSEGDIVWVDYGNKLNWKDPVYLGAVNKKPGSGAGGAPPGGAGAYGNSCGGQYQRSATPAAGGGGDSLPGKNAPQQPYSGLPRLQRVDLEKGLWGKAPNEQVAFDSKWVVNESAPYGKGTYKGFRNAVEKKCPYIIRTYFGHIAGNGENDPKNRPNQRSSLVVAPWYFDPTQPWELIYFFHGLGGFASNTLSKRIVPNIVNLIKTKRNFVYVKPQLGHGMSGAREGQTDSFNKKKHPGRGGDFEQYHNNILGIIQKHITTAKLIAPRIGMYAWSAGGATLGAIAASGAMAKVAPHKIFFADAEYYWGYKDVPNKPGVTTRSALAAVWHAYVKDNPKVHLTLMTGTGKVDRNTQRAFNAIKKNFDLKGRPVYYWATGKSHGWCGTNALFLVSPEHKNSAVAAAAVAASAVKPAKTTDDEDTKAETEENKMEEESTSEEVKEAQEQDPEAPKKTTTEDPPDNKPKKSASEKPKEGAKEKKSGGIMEKMQAAKESTAKSAVAAAKVSQAKKNYKFQPVGADTWKENRVKLRHYGGTIVNSKDKLLAKLKGDGEFRKAHVLVAKRYQAMKAAAAAEGIGMRVASGWRRHKWKSKQHYEEHIAKKHPKGDGRKWVAFNSPHETGMALDIVTHPAVKGEGIITTKGAELSGRNKNSPLGKWLIANAWKFGFAPYKGETWHWEVRLPVHAWVTGEEFTDNFAVRVTKIGSKVRGFTGSGQFGNSKVSAQGGGSVGTGGSGPCIHVPSGVSGMGDPLVAGIGTPLQVTNAPPVSGLGDKLKMGTPGVAATGNVRYMQKLVSFCVHETAGWPTNINVRKKNQDSYADKGGHPCSVHFWGTSDGGILQTCHPATRMWHAQGGSLFSTSIETCTMGPTHTRYHGMIPKFIGMGFHFISTTKGLGDILSDDGCTAGNAKAWKVMMVPTPQMQESLYKLIYGLVKSPPSNDETKWRYGGKSGKTEINIQMTFPCVEKSSGKYWWGPWYGKPGSVHWKKAEFAAYSSEWFKQNQPPGIFCHWNVGHHADGCMGVFYVMARALGMKPSDAYYAMIGAATTTKYDKKVKNFWSRLPIGADGKDLIKKGKAKYPWALDAKTYVDLPGCNGNPYWMYKNGKLKTELQQWVEDKKIFIGDLENPIK